MCFFSFFIDTAATEINTIFHTLSLHDALPISHNPRHEVRLLGREQSRNAPQVKKIIDSARAFHARLDVMIKRADREDREAERLESLALQDRKSTRLNSRH